MFDVFAIEVVHAFGDIAGKVSAGASILELPCYIRVQRRTVLHRCSAASEPTYESEI